MSAFSFNKQVEFCETDAAGIAHFSSLAIYMEQTEHALFRTLGLSVFPRPTAMSTSAACGHDSDCDAKSSPSGAPSATQNTDLVEPLNVTWPRVHVSLDFLGPARFEDVLTIEVVVAKLGQSSVTFEHLIHGPQHPVARGTSISVCCRIDRSGSHQLIKLPIPQAIRDKLSQYLRA
ncbi:MAG: acyl-CoA thioesterase [Pirellula sp.]|nr:acyl-CoA thioesterase [Pirellula sp.]